jgi:lipopolysaccharide/colanic/teichoic acid biosynthesis glycosyltransferase
MRHGSSERSRLRHFDLTGSSAAGSAYPRAKRLLDGVVAAALLALLLPILFIAALAVVFESRGGVFYRCTRVGRRGVEFPMLKFRKMRVGAAGPALTARDDERFTRVGRVLARTKIDELPQLWNVLRGQMSLVGPRPEDPRFVELHRADYAAILEIPPGITGLCQLAFAREAEILDDENPVDDYVERLLPQKARLDALYARKRTLLMDFRILAWTAMVVVLRREVAVHRETAKLSVRRRPRTQTAVAAADSGAA